MSSKITLLDNFSSFQIFSFSINSKELLSNGPYASKMGLSIIKLLGTEFIISHTFQCERFFFLLVLENLMKYNKGDFAGHCCVYSNISMSSFLSSRLTFLQKLCSNVHFYKFSPLCLVRYCTWDCCIQVIVGN